ncbi:c-type cytochrome [Algoriphagus zhangzhouensis]|uniref:Cytochrome c n=1 Tax=Algoriphagus zhangzhouensis TaxID=1073327 RepID=A0A1M7ZAB0_9BACT|nr:c-type cytochrome [Algoriphagus zhangzhouensis]TDY47220.1 cytochrome c [Algoriphagus zhangzhouensis]SHO61814.1 cytochrome c [Algoriphagus zhangzhouensis]
MGLRYTITFLIGLGILFSCQSSKKEADGLEEVKASKDEFFIVPGEDELLDSLRVKSGKVLISYSDCFECHKLDQDATGPSFSDIARRYPSNQTYVEFLARKVISGGSGTWGTPVMRAHPSLSQNDAEKMVTYILSLDF